MRKVTYAAIGLVAAALLVSCSKASKGFSVSASSRGPGAAATAPGTTPSPALDGGNGLSIDEVQLVLKRVEVEGPGACSAPVTTPPPMMDEHGGSGGDGGDVGEDGEDGDECEISGGPFLVDLSGTALTSGGVHVVTALDVPAGTFDEVKFKIGTISVADAGTDAGLTALATAGASVKVTGTRNAAPFTFTTDLTVVQKREGTIVVDPTTGANVTLDFDPSGWFKAADGTFLDPADPAMLATIQQNIRASLRVVSDDDEDGEEDSGEHH
jgi:hypothetical protein